MKSNGWRGGRQNGLFPGCACNIIKENVGCGKALKKQGDTMDIKAFKKPPSILRPAPFWAINEEITPEETARQMTDMLRV